MENYYRKFRYYTFIMILFLFTWELVYVLSRLTKLSNDSSVKNRKTKFILLYEVPDWMDEIHILDNDNDCVVTRDRQYFSDIREFDALVFSGSDPWSARHVFPKQRSPHQYYVFADLESPYFTLHKFSTVLSEEIYNLTMTYRRDSDIYWPYGFITDRTIDYVSDLEVPEWQSPIFEKDDQALKHLQTKNKTAAWFVSHCPVPSNRTALVAALKKSIDVDIYGKCGTLVCGRERTDECYELAESQYFFYFSFENSLCKDYLTEKIFNIMKYYIVPVVYGGANYSHYLPPHSFIDASSFPTATELAKYLKYLIEHPEEYLKYFWWKKYYKNISTNLSYDNLCKKLDEFTSMRYMSDGQLVKTYKNISSWWEVDQCVKEPKIKFI
ncbi:Alpha-(1,3)-fucosyltransferase C [Sergentomyia squamirostris]